VDRTTSRQIFWALCASALFLALGAIFIPRAGLQTDEALFGTPLYLNHNNDLWSRLAGGNVPLMIMTYLGSLKSLLFAPIFETLGVNIWTIRLPVVLLGGATIFLFYRLTHLTVGPRQALAGAFVLATDPVFLLTSTYDWGPVALEHFLLVTGCLALFRFGTQSGPNWHGRGYQLALGSACFGLALWNKAIFLWALAGLAAAGLAVLRPWRSLTLRTLVIASVSFLAGAAPFISYNIRQPLITFRQNAHLEPQAIGGKFVQLQAALQGNSLFGYVASEEWDGPAITPTGALGRTSAALREHLGPRRNTGFFYVLAALLAAVPLWWRSSTAWFSLIFCTVAWLWMAMTHDAGASAHHVVLLWPFPLLFVAAALRRLPTPVLVVATVAMVGSNLTVVNQYLVQLERQGAHDSYTTAIFPLSDALPASSTLYITDWGLFDALNLFHRGGLKLRAATDPLVPAQPSAEQILDLDRMFADPQGLFVGHVKGREAFVGVGEHLDGQVARAGLRREILRVFRDAQGREMFEISRVVAR
jgi:4-amino-4-deoxy-L-arabinose transferase-like glycosyltransferase